jgi:hypothetical protein
MTHERKLLCRDRNGHQLAVVRLARGKVYLAPTPQGASSGGAEFEWSPGDEHDAFVCKHGEFQMPRDAVVQLRKRRRVLIAERAAGALL